MDELFPGVLPAVDPGTGAEQFIGRDGPSGYWPVTKCTGPFPQSGERIGEPIRECLKSSFQTRMLLRFSYMASKSCQIVCVFVIVYACVFVRMLMCAHVCVLAGARTLHSA